MRILYVLNATILAGGGNKSFLRLLEQVAKKHTVKIVAPDNNEITPYLRERGYDVEVVRYEFAVMPLVFGFRDVCLFLPRLIRKLYRNHAAAPRIAKIAKEFKADIIHSNASVINGGKNAALSLGIPHILHVREYSNPGHGWHSYGLNRRLKGEGRYSICITHDIAKEMKVDGLDTNRCIYNPIVEESEIVEIEPKQNYFLYAGRIDPDKGIKELIEGYILYCKRKGKDITPLKLAGSLRARHQSELRRSMDERLQSEGLSEHVEWLGERKDIYDLMRHTKATIIPSLYEGFGRVFPEALAQGSAVAARYAGGLKEQYDNGIELTGEEIALKFDTPSELAEVMQRLDSMTEEERNAMIARGQQTVHSLYTNSASGRKVLEFYEYVATDYAKKR